MNLAPFGRTLSSDLWFNSLSMLRELTTLEFLIKRSNMKSCFPSFLACAFIYFISFILIFLLSAQNVYSLDVKLAWNPNSERDLVAGYRIFYREEGQSYNYEEPAWEGSETTCTIYNLDDNTTYYFVARAFDIGDSESGDSNEACYALQGTVEIGEVSVDHNWKWVEFSEAFSDPVVVAKPLSYNGGDPAVVRIRDVDSTGFDIRIQEWDYLDGTHTTENVSYIVMERGNYILEDGAKVEAGTFDTDITSSFGWVDFSQTFNQAPVVITAVSSYHGADAVTTRVRNVSINGFEFRMQEQELNSQSHTTETISYIAWEPSSGTVGDLTFEVEKTDDVITDDWQTIVYNETFMNPPVFLADMQTTDGKDTANLRWQDKDFYGIDVKIAEEQSLDSETDHTTEVVGYMVFAFGE